MRDFPERAELERQLVQRPLDKDLRARYGAMLMAHECWDEALIQFQFLMEVNANQAEPVVQAALCELQLKNRQEAVTLYTRAKALQGFTSNAALDALTDEASGARAHLQLVKSAPGSNVVELVRPAGGKIGFNDIAGMDMLKKTLRMQIIEPFRNPGLFAKFSKRAGGGVLLYGPPGCGKTMMARAIATECHATFMAIGLTDILSMWIGESEHNLARLFEKARADKPTVLFFDELDALAFARSKAQSEHTRQLVNEFLSQLDGFAQGNHDVMIMAATNMPWDIDPAVKRPGRFNRQIFVPPPDEKAREKMFELKLHGVPCEVIDYAALAAASEYCSGADIDGVVDMAKEAALSDILQGASERRITQDDLRAACEAIVPSTLDWLRTAKNLVKYGGVDRSYKEVETYLGSKNIL